MAHADITVRVKSQLVIRDSDAAPLWLVEAYASDPDRPLMLAVIQAPDDEDE